MTPSPDFKRNKTIADLIADTRKPKLLPETGWYRLAVTELFEGVGVGGSFVGSSLNVFKNSWENVVEDNSPPASWYLSQNGEVRFRGKVSGGAAQTILTVLPPQVRPEYAETFIVAVDGGGNATITVRPNGEVFVEAINTVI